MQQYPKFLIWFYNGCDVTVQFEDVFLILFLLYNFSCKMKIGNRIVKDPDEVAEDCMTL